MCIYNYIMTKTKKAIYICIHKVQSIYYDKKRRRQKHKTEK